jgi:hypothetical protein
MIQWAKFASKAKKIGSSAKRATIGTGLAIGNTFRTFPKDAVKEFKGVKRAAKRTAKKFPNTFMKYPITTGAVGGLGIGLATPTKEKKKNGK